VTAPSLYAAVTQASLHAAVQGTTTLGWNVGGDISQVLAEHFMVNALRAGTIVAVVSGAIGWFMVLRRQSFAGHTLAVVSFPGAAGAVLIGAGATAGYFGASAVAAVVIAMVPRAADGRAGVHEPAVIGTVQAFALACGALFVELYGGFLNSLTGLLFGTFLGVSDAQVATLAGVGAAALAVLALIGRPLLFATVDAGVARARGVPVGILSAVFLVLLGVAAAEVSQITGALLVFSLLVMPAAAAQRLTANPRASFAMTLAFGVVVVWLGLGAAYFSTYPVGFFVTTFAFALYLMSLAISVAADRLGRRSGTPRSGTPRSGAPA
jgi:zinc/manganese transport system permease protein